MSTVPSAIRFLLDGIPHELARVAPTRTVLQVLREDLNRTGSKEGCAEGDCGACTVVLAESIEENGVTRLRARAVNSCIQFAPTLDGKALYTVESLKRAGALHPVQQAMVDCHGSQCGFCTPGFVMSLFALYKSDPAPSRTAINDALAGNLCRCTGYRPIVDAASAMYALGHAQPDDAQDWLRGPAGVVTGAAEAEEAALLAQLAALKRSELCTFAHPDGDFHAPRSLAELASLRERLPHARIVAGSTDVGLWVTKQHRALGDVIYTGHVTALTQMAIEETFIEIGAAVTVTDAMSHLTREYADFDELLRRFGSPPIRNAATLGGNVANGSPIGDSMPALIALSSRIVLRRGAVSRELALEDFYLGYQENALAQGEFVERLRVPRARPNVQFRTYKVSKRFDQDIAALCGAFAVEIVGETVRAARIAYGGMAPIPQRARRAEAALADAAWSEATTHAAMVALAADFAPITDMRASARYRQEVAANLLLKFFHETQTSTRQRLYDMAEPR